MRASKNPNLLVVEGFDDLFSVVGLMKHHVDWPDDRNIAPVWIEGGRGAEAILEKNYISTLVKDPTIKTLGVMLDADSDAKSRFASFRNLCIGLFPNIPNQLSENGLIVENEDGKRIGLWIMPDNISNGALEIFLKFLVPDLALPSWKHAISSVAEAKRQGAPYRDCHVDKANLYSWLAWQDEPGQSPGNALTRKILDPKSQKAIPFVKWFMQLYSLQPPADLPGLVRPLHR